MTDVIEISLAEIRGTSCEVDAVNRIEKYINFLEEIIKQMTSDGGHEESQENLRWEFERDCL